jgi:hypothetical protein
MGCVAMPEKKYLTPEEVSERYCGRISVGTLRNWRGPRLRRKSPPFVKFGRLVLYPLDALEGLGEGTHRYLRSTIRP